MSIDPLRGRLDDLTVSCPPARRTNSTRRRAGQIRTARIRSSGMRYDTGEPRVWRRESNSLPSPSGKGIAPTQRHSGVRVPEGAPIARLAQLVEPAAHNGLECRVRVRRRYHRNRGGLHDYGAHPALVLNADFRPMSYFPLSLLSWQDAVHDRVQRARLGRGRVRPWSRSPSTGMRLPSVVALREYRPIADGAWRSRASTCSCATASRCQYCGEAFSSAKQLTFEHVIPRSRGGQTTWANIVTACEPCNTGKGNTLRMKPHARAEGADARRAAGRQAPLPAELSCTRAGRTILYWDVELES